MRRIAEIGLVVAALVLAGSAAAETTTILLVRHAEKVPDRSADPELTDEGRAHAEALARELGHVEVAAIYSTPFKRTRDTAMPVAQAKGLDVTIAEVGPDLARRLAEQILAKNRGRNTLVVGHSNTLGPTIEALGCGASFDLDESVYGDLFVCTIPDEGKPTLLRLRAW